MQWDIQNKQSVLFYYLEHYRCYSLFGIGGHQLLGGFKWMKCLFYTSFAIIWYVGKLKINQTFK